MVSNAEVDTKAQERFWNKLTQFKFDLNYYSYHFSLCVVTLRWIRMGTSALTALFTGAWMTWSDNHWIEIICPIAIFALQVFSAASEVFPYEKRKQELRELSNLLELVYSEMEQDWLSIADGQLSKNQIIDKISYYEKRRHDIQQHYFRDDALPENKRIMEKAEVETGIYFKNF